MGIAVVWFHCQRGHALHQVHDRDIDMFDCLSEWWTAPSDVDSAEVSFLAFLTAPRRLDKKLRGVPMISGAGLELNVGAEPLVYARATGARHSLPEHHHDPALPFARHVRSIVIDRPLD